VIGESACASQENFDAEIVREIARANAKKAVYQLLGFRLRDKLAKQIRLILPCAKSEVRGCVTLGCVTLNNSAACACIIVCARIASERQARETLFR